MNRIDVDQVLAQMRTISAEVRDNGMLEKDAEVRDDFSQMQKNSIDSVNQTQQTAADMAKAFETGEGDANLAEIMVASQKSSLAFDAMVQVLDGEAELTIGGKKVTPKTGETVIMPANVPHAVRAVKRFKMLLTMIRG